MGVKVKQSSAETRITIITLPFVSLLHCVRSSPMRTQYRRLVLSFFFFVLIHTKPKKMGTFLLIPRCFFTHASGPMLRQFHPISPNYGPITPNPLEHGRMLLFALSAHSQSACCSSSRSRFSCPFLFFTLSSDQAVFDYMQC